MSEFILEAMVLIGCTIIVSLYYLSKKSATFEENITNFIIFNDDINQDVLKLLEECWPFFLKAGFVGFKCSICWFGTQTFHCFGLESRHKIEFEQKHENIKIVVTAFTSKSKAEKQHFENVFWQNFLLLLKMDLLIKVNSIHSTEKQLQKYNSFLLHDMKNIAQLIVMVDGQMKKQPVANTKKMLTMLEGVIPSVRIRADRVIQTLTQKESYLYKAIQKVEINLAEKITSIADIYSVGIFVKGSAVLDAEEEKLDQIFDNLINNYVQHDKDKHIVKVKIVEDNEKIIVRFQSDIKVENYNRVRLFEPFWSSSDHGMGLGLYHCQNLLKNMGADIDVNHLEDKSLEFVMTFTKKT